MLHGLGARIIGGQRQREVAVVPLQQLAQVARSRVDVLLRVVNVLHSHPLRRLRQQLHQPAGILGRQCFWIEVGLHGNYAGDEVGIHAVAQVPRMPGDLLSIVAQEVGDVEACPEPIFHPVG